MKIHADMPISEIMEKVPQAGLILADFQLGCFNCHFSTYETLRNGVLGHGMTEEDVNRIIDEINEIASRPRTYIDVGGIIFTEEAYDKVLYFIRNDPDKREGLALRIEIAGSDTGKTQYFFDLVTKKKKAETEHSKGDLKVYLNKKTAEHFKTHCIDYQETASGAGFKVEKTIT